MSNEMRELLLRIVGDSYQDSLRAVGELRALLAKPAEQPQGEPEGYKYRLKSKNRAWTYSANRPEFAEEEFEILPLYTRPAEQPEPISSTSDKYKAELYDEVWQLARGMGFGNVTDALKSIASQVDPEQGAPVVKISRATLYDMTQNQHKKVAAYMGQISEALRSGEDFAKQVRDILDDTYEAAYGEGQNNPNGYSSKGGRDRSTREAMASLGLG